MAVKIAAAIVCDYTQVREGLLTVVSGGITRLWRDQVPGPFGIELAVLVEVPPEERSDPHELHVTVTGPNGEELAKLGGGFQLTNVPAGTYDADEPAFMPLPLDLRTVNAIAYGWHSIKIRIDDGEAVERRVKMAPRPTGAPGALPLNREQRRKQRHN